MAFPSITFKHTHTDEAKPLEEVVEKKFSAFDKFIGSASDARCEVEFQKVTASKSGDIYRVEANVWRGGRLFRAEATAGSFAAAIDVVRDELDNELRKAHDKRESLVRRGGRKLKEMLRWGK